MAKRILFLLSLLSYSHFATSSLSNTPSLFPAAFFFGDSTLDTGNNGYIPTIVRANHYPYGRDFAGVAATGRFSDGLLVPDLLCAKLGIKRLSPPFLNPNLTDADLLTGVNFASASSGFDDLTSVLLNSIPFSRQVEMFRAYLDRLRRIVGKQDEAAAAMRVRQSLFFVSSGTNDFLLNFYYFPTRKKTMTMDEYQDFLLQKASKFFKELYDLGCRKFIIAGLPPIGCIPLQMSMKISGLLTRTCIDSQNEDAMMYNTKLQSLLSKLEQEDSLLDHHHPEKTKFVYLDMYNFIMNIINNATQYGFDETKKGCCGTGLIEVGLTCNKLTPLCKNVSSFVFFDSVHPTERIYKLFAEHLMDKLLSKLF